jgi:tRNA pseudouridine55 synthase
LIGSGFDGLVVIDKPSGLTSRDVVNRAQGWFPPGTRLGHTGTLDPLATGVLVLCIGKATRLAEYVQRMSKVYYAGIVLGATSDTDDAVGQITPTLVSNLPTRDEVMQALAGFIGTVEQVPPAYSAAKVTGRRAYDLARRGNEFVLAPRLVTIHAMDVVTFVYPHLHVIVHCGKGTYIRSLARDLGARLGCGGYIASLRRTRVGCFTPEDAVSLNLEPLQARQRILPMAHAVRELPGITLDAALAKRLLHGQHIDSPIAIADVEAAVFDEADRLLAVADVTEGVLHVKKSLLGVHEV